MRRRFSSLLLVLACCASIVALGATRAGAGPHAYVWANDPSADLYEPPPEYASNPGGGSVSIARHGTGAYAVFFGGLNGIGEGGGNVQVTGYGSSSTRCKVEGWIGEVIDVLCFDEAGNPADEQFLLLFTRTEPETPGVAYAWANQADNASYTPNPGYSYNPTGGSVTIERSGVGNYEVIFLGLDAVGLDGGNVQATAYGSGSEYCKVQSWDADSAVVRCFDTAGAAADSQFTVLFTKPTAETPDLFYVWANDANAPAPYEPDPDYAYDASGGTVQVSRSGEGSYQVTFPGLDELTVQSGAHVQVTAYGPNNRTCKVEGWEGESVAVFCVDVGGNQADTVFSTLVVAPEAGALGCGVAMLGALRLMQRRAPRARR